MSTGRPFCSLLLCYSITITADLVFFKDDVAEENKFNLRQPDIKENLVN